MHITWSKYFSESASQDLMHDIKENVLSEKDLKDLLSWTKHYLEGGEWLILNPPNPDTVLEWIDRIKQGITADSKQGSAVLACFQKALESVQK